MKHRCACGCRIFFEKPCKIITDAGVVFAATSFNILECVRCKRDYLCDMANGKKKTLELLSSGAELERRLFVEWVKTSINTNYPKAPNRDFVTADPDDQREFKRLNVTEDEVYSKEEVAT